MHPLPHHCILFVLGTPDPDTAFQMSPQKDADCNNSNTNISNGSHATLKHSGFSHTTLHYTSSRNCLAVNYTWKGCQRAVATAVTAHVFNELSVHHL